MRNNRNHISKTIFVILILFWFLISIFNVGFNLLKGVSEAMYWLPLTDNQKRHEIFGNIYDFIKFIENHTEENSKILIFSKDDKTYFLGRYLLYPRQIFVTFDTTELKKTDNIKNYKYIAVFNFSIALDGYEISASSSSGLGNWQLYKKK